MAKQNLPSGELTALLHAWRGGDRKAEGEVWALVYEELRQLARRMRPQHGGRAAPGTVTVVHETYLRLFGGADIEWRERSHFYAVAARAMRFVLVDQARRRLAKKRDAEFTEIAEELAEPSSHTPEHVLAIHQALDRLAEINPRQEKLVELHYFAGLTLDESAEVLGVSRSTAMRDWKAVRIWLHGELEAAGGTSAGA